MHNFTLFSREKEWKLKWFHSFREMKSEIIFPFTHSENEKWNENALRSRSRMKSEMKMPRDRDWEVKYQKNSREFSRNETLAGYWSGIAQPRFGLDEDNSQDGGRKTLNAGKLKPF